MDWSRIEAIYTEPDMWQYKTLWKECVDMGLVTDMDGTLTVHMLNLVNNRQVSRHHVTKVGKLLAWYLEWSTPSVAFTGAWQMVYRLHESDRECGERIIELVQGYVEASIWAHSGERATLLGKGQTRFYDTVQDRSQYWSVRAYVLPRRHLWVEEMRDMWFKADAHLRYRLDRLPEQRMVYLSQLA